MSHLLLLGIEPAVFVCLTCRGLNKMLCRAVCSGMLLLTFRPRPQRKLDFFLISVTAGGRAITARMHWTDVRYSSVNTQLWIIPRSTTEHCYNQSATTGERPEVLKLKPQMNLQRSLRRIKNTEEFKEIQLRWKSDFYWRWNIEVMKCRCLNRHSIGRMINYSRDTEYFLSHIYVVGDEQSEIWKLYCHYIFAANSGKFHFIKRV